MKVLLPKRTVRADLPTPPAIRRGHQQGACERGRGARTAEDDTVEFAHEREKCAPCRTRRGDFRGQRREGEGRAGSLTACGGEEDSTGGDPRAGEPQRSFAPSLGVSSTLLRLPIISFPGPRLPFSPTNLLAMVNPRVFLDFAVDGTPAGRSAVPRHASIRSSSATDSSFQGHLRALRRPRPEDRRKVRPPFYHHRRRTHHVFVVRLQLPCAMHRREGSLTTFRPPAVLQEQHHPSFHPRVHDPGWRYVSHPSNISPATQARPQISPNVMALVANPYTEVPFLTKTSVDPSMQRAYSVWPTRVPTQMVLNSSSHYVTALISMVSHTSHLSSDGPLTR